MNSRKLAIFGAALAAFAGAGTLARAAEALSWPPITAQTRPWAFNWWMGSAVDKANLTRELERYHAGGLGGIHIIPIYGAKGFESKFIPYLSPQWMEMMGWAVSEAHRLGMGVDMTLGTGWCFGGPTVTDADANAKVVVKTFSLSAGERWKEKFDRASIQALVAYGPDGKATELTDSISADGDVSFSPPGNGAEPAGASKAWTVYAISQGPSGQRVKRPAPGGEGWMLNPLYPKAVSDWLQWFDAAFKNYDGPKPRAVYQDSYEYSSNWAPDLFAQFEKLRGYKLQDELPALFGSGEDELSARVKCDYRQTVSEVMARESQPEWIDWAHAHGFLTRNQAHGSPGNLLDLYADADIPETEMFHDDHNKLVSKFASSASHVAGHPLTSAETGTWLAEHFTETLAELKYLADDMFLSGINHIFYHGCCYSPDEAGWPGWHFYASAEMNPRNSIWHDAPALDEYIARCQAILQSGQPDNDVLLYWPIADYWMKPGKTMLPHYSIGARDWFTSQPIGDTAAELWKLGYAFDYVSDAQLMTAKVEHGKIAVPGGKYKTVVVPPCQYIPLETFRQLLALAEKGATVIFVKDLPSDVPGEKDLEKRRAEFKKLAESVSTGAVESMTGGRAKRFGSGEVLFGGGTQVRQVGVKLETLTQSGLSFVRRSFDGGWNYFIANQGGKDFDSWITLARPAKSSVVLDPMTGKSGVAAMNANGKIHLQLVAGGSVILRALTAEKVDGPAWNYWQANGEPVAINGPWMVKFIDGGPKLPADFEADKARIVDNFSGPEHAGFCRDCEI